MNTKRTSLILILAALGALLTLPVYSSGPGEFRFDDDSIEVIEEVGMAVVTVERSSGEDGAVSVDYMTAGGTASPGSDYTATSGTLTWSDDDGADRTFVVPILDDGDSEGEEIIELILLNATGGAVIDTGHAAATVTILASDEGGEGEEGEEEEGEEEEGEEEEGEEEEEGDRAGTIKFDESSFEVLEDAGVAIVTVERSQGEDGAVSIGYFTRDLDALDGEDYTAVAGSLQWFDGDGSDKTFAVPILDDADAEGDESFELVLENPTGGAAIDSLRGISVVRILANDGAGGGGGEGEGGGEDNDSPGVLKFDERSFEVLEGSGVAVITVERSMGEGGEVSVDYSTADDTAFDGEDYTAVSGTLTWPAGDGSAKTFMVPITADDLDEGNEVIALALTNPTGGAQLDAQRATSILTIIDDDAPVCAENTLCLNGGRFEVQVTWMNFEGVSGAGRPLVLSDQSGLFWFFDRDNVEMLIKVLDACRGFDSFWVFFAATTNVGFDVSVTDTLTGVSQTYHNAPGDLALPVQDLSTFQICP